MKNLFKRIFCLILVIAVAGSMFTVSAEEETGDMSENMKKILEVLRMFEIIPDYYDYNTNLQETVSRANFADAVGKIINASAGISEGTYYYDVPETHYAYNGICALTEMGIINGTGDNLFKPDDAIETASACKIILSLLGYGIRAEYDGGYPAGYIKVANRIGLLDKSVSSGSLTRGDMLTILYNSLITPMYSASIFSDDDGNTYQQDTSQTLLTIYRDVYYEKGIVNAAEMVSISDYSVGKPDEVYIDDVKYTSNVRLKDLLGEEVECFVYKENEGLTGNIIWAKATGKTKTVTVKRNTADFDEVSYTYSYYDDNGNEKRINIDRGLTLIYNGRAVESGISDILKKADCDFKFVMVNNVCQTAIAREYENYVVDRIDLTEMTAYDKADPNKSLKLDERIYDYLVIRHQSGAEMTIEDLQSGYVLSAYLSLDEKYLEILVSSNQGTGVVERKRNSDKGTVITVSGEDYILPDGVTLKTDISIGDTVRLYLDIDGYVAYADVTPISSYAAYVYDAAIIEDGFDAKVTLKLLKQDGTLAVMQLSDKVKVNDSREDAENALKWLESNNSFKPQVVLVRVNGDGEIYGFTAGTNPDGTKNNDFFINYKASNARYKANQATFNGNVMIDNDTVIFKVPEDTWLDDAKDTDFSIVGKGSLSDDTLWNIESYKTTDRVACENYVVIKYKSTSDSSNDYTLPVLISGTGQVLTDDGVAADSIEGYQGSSQISIPIAEDSAIDRELIKEGVLARCYLDKNGCVDNISVLYDPENPTYDYGLYNNRYRIHKGMVKDVMGDLMLVGVPDKEDRVVRKAGEVLIYDSEDDRNPIKKNVQFADTKPAINWGEDCSDVVIISQYEVPRLIVIYR